MNVVVVTLPQLNFAQEYQLQKLGFETTVSGLYIPGHVTTVTTVYADGKTNPETAARLQYMGRSGPTHLWALLWCSVTFQRYLLKAGVFIPPGWRKQFGGRPDGEPLTRDQLSAAYEDFTANLKFRAKATRRELENRFPWLLKANPDISGADVISDLADWYSEVTAA